ncbi:lamin tail domain-containing protein 1-like isoform X2 [Engraulis encrasicolus]|uniref:lamin tail domain-containing protein 1-like isoform X2 n=1 Tax=Engraulis encrasicolus TaxID=184585 RepID=UPI002FD22190
MESCARLVERPRTLAWSRRPVTAPCGLSSGGSCSRDIWDIFINKLDDKTPPVRSQKTKRPSTAKQHLHQYSSAIGAMKIVEVESEGRFVRLRNVSRAEQDVGGYYLQQSVRGQPVSCFLFPPRTFIQPGVSITVWAEDCRSNAYHLRDYVWTGLPKMGTTPEYTTILCMTNGEAVAWYTPAQRSLLRACQPRQAWEEPWRETHSSRAAWSLSRGDNKNALLSDITKQEPHPRHVAPSPTIPLQRKSREVRLSQSPWTQNPSTITHPDCLRDWLGTHATANSRVPTRAPIRTPTAKGSRKAKPPPNQASTKRLSREGVKVCREVWLDPLTRPHSIRGAALHI